MKYLLKISSASLFVFAISLLIAKPVLAIPPLPSSSYGTVKVNGANVSDGTVVQALIDGQVYAEGYTQTYQGNSVYSLNVRGDDSETAARDGGREGDAIQFKIGGALANQTAVWHTGANVNLNLTASSSGTISTPQATPTSVPTQTAIVIVQSSPVPTQTAIVIVQPSPVPTAIDQVSSTLAVSGQPSQIAAKPLNPSPIPSMTVEASLTPAKSESNETNVSSGIGQRVIIIGILVLAVIIGYLFLTLRRKRI